MPDDAVSKLGPLPVSSSDGILVRGFFFPHNHNKKIIETSLAVWLQ
jgi:hypothetical protein